MRKSIYNVLMIFLMLLAFQSAGWAEDGCVTEKCHSDMGTKKFVHGPVGAGICTVCHNRVEENKHEFAFAAEKEELCLGCHEARRDMMLEEHVHTPVAEGKCTVCHDPHQSDFRYTLEGKAADLCYTCHDKSVFSKALVHGPVGAGDCNACHNPHASANEKQLLAPPKEICFSCHNEQSDIMTKRHVHPPVKEKCTNCHDPHSNSSKFLLSSDSPDLCFRCHSEFAANDTCTYKHDPVAQGQCDVCHDVHATDNPRMFLYPQVDLCLSCHSELDEYVKAQKYKHGPVKEGDCNACHNPHGSGNFRILRKDFPEEFYMPFEIGNYAICFECHSKDIALDQKTRTLTDFRDDDRNLHYLHVNKEVKGRSCKACHQVHASNQEKHVRESVPFGSANWDLPVTYTKYDNGGKCVVGCHAPKEYHRK